MRPDGEAIWTSVNASLVRLRIPTTRSYEQSLYVEARFDLEEVRRPFKESIPGCEAVDLVVDSRERGTAAVSGSL